MKQWIGAVLFLSVNTLVAAGAEEAEIDAEFGSKRPESQENDPKSATASDSMRFKFNGYVENEMFFNAPARTETTDAKPVKLENHLNLLSRYGNDRYFFHSEIDAYYYPERGVLSRDNPHDNRSVELQELYLSAGEKYQFRAGKMRVDHSTADVFSVNNFLAQRDLREVFGVRKNVRDRGIFALALKGVWGDFMAEAIATPLHSAPLFPTANSFWAIRFPSQSMAHPLMPTTTMNLTPRMQTGTEFENSLKYTSGIIRTGGNVAGLDFHLIYFNGIDNSLMFQPTTTIDWAGDPTKSGINIEPIFNKTETYAFDLAYAYKRVSGRFEAAYTPAKWLVHKSEMDQTIDAGNKITLRNKTSREQYFAYTAGFDVKLYHDESLLLVEFTQSQPLRDKGKYMQEFMTEMLLIRLEDKFLDNHLLASLGGIVRPLEKAPGFILMSQIGWDFANGLEMMLGATIFVGRDDQILKPFEDNDFFYTNVKMNF